jgi:hypothetical protein
MRPVTEHAADRAHDAIDRAAAQVGGAEARLRQAADASAETLAATSREAKAALVKTGGMLRRHRWRDIDRETAPTQRLGCQCAQHEPAIDPVARPGRRVEREALEASGVTG